MRLAAGRPDAPANLFEPVPDDCGSRGRFDALLRRESWAAVADRHRGIPLATAALAVEVLGLCGLTARCSL